MCHIASEHEKKNYHENGNHRRLLTLNNIEKAIHFRLNTSKLTN